MVTLAQEVDLPPDFRQHNLTEYNSSLFSPIFSLDRNQPKSLALWTRWQWQSIDGDPTTLMFNYTHRLNRHSAAGLGFFQHNTGYFLETGAIANYAYGFELGTGIQLAFGLNVFGYQRKPADERFQPDPDIPLPPQLDVGNDFILQVAPGIRFQYQKFGIGLVGENFLDYNFTESGQLTDGSEKVYIGFASYQIPVFIFGNSEDSYIQPTVYLKTLPGMDDQYGITGLFNTPKFWGQLGYNNFYGVSAGLGGRFFRNVSIGALMETGSSSSFEGSDTSIELVMAYNFGPGDIRKRIVGFDTEEEEEVKVVPAEVAVNEDDKAREEQIRDSIAAVRNKEAAAALALQEQNELAARRKREQDSLAAAELRQQKEQRMLDSLAQVALAEKKAATEKVVPKPGEKYEETTTIDGLVPGYYLIANVFGTKKYYEAFMKTLGTKGLAPKSFYRSVNKYNYVYLERYDTMEEARKARDSKFGGRYQDALWIFRVVPD
jgi:type IX secretion system PorP/SprF family membrane protein